MKKIYSMDELCKRLKLTRARYYQLKSKGFFPEPKRTDTNLPYFTEKDLIQHLDYKDNGIGFNETIQRFNKKVIK